MGYDYILEAMQVTRMVLVMILMKILGKIIFLMMLMIMATHKAINILPQLDGDLENDSADVLEVILDPHNGLGNKKNNKNSSQHHGLGHLPQPDNFTTCGR